MKMIDKINRGDYAPKTDHYCDEWEKELKILREKFKQDLFEEFEVSNNSKAEMLYELLSQSQPYLEGMFNFFEKYVVLIK